VLKIFEAASSYYFFSAAGAFYSLLEYVGRFSIWKDADDAKKKIVKFSLLFSWLEKKFLKLIYWCKLSYFKYLTETNTYLFLLLSSHAILLHLPRVNVSLVAKQKRFDSATKNDFRHQRLNIVLVLSTCLLIDW